MENQNVESSNLEDNPVQTLVETLGKDIKIEVDPSCPPIENHGSQDLNSDELGVRTNTKPLLSAEEKEEQLV